MIKLKNIKMKPKITVLFLLAGIVPLLLTGWWSGRLATKALMDEAYKDLVAMREIKKAQITRFFVERQGDLQALVKNSQMLLEAGLSWKVMGTSDEVEAGNREPGIKKEDYYSKFIKEYNYHDLFLIDAEGYIFYTVKHEPDYKTNILTGKYASSGLAALVRAVIIKRDFGMADFEPYAPSDDEPAAFVAQPVIHNGKVKMIVALQISNEAINSIMQQDAGMGETEETYLVGSDKRMRSDTRLQPEVYSIKASFADPTKGRIDTEAVREGLKGKTGEKIITDYRGKKCFPLIPPLIYGGRAGSSWLKLMRVKSQNQRRIYWFQLPWER